MPKGPCRARDAGGLTLRIEDMTCGHCAGTIKRAVESALPGIRVDADPASKPESVRGTADLSAVIRGSLNGTIAKASRKVARCRDHLVEAVRS
ncbi:hypothetical protein DC522_05175 [Microvirga sp. KLBC 81]|uniref:heavy-metal-associated domain-containing protein n=1 Tax=Microvirga sp. KLBC 81 TaxID=1862707 RepID=UPI000D50767E|nr:heavy-metal-associated domain-containing protein [Microvirga sp. KLBC 81]PVE25707.1 hypothetical protein DC522_05175 [Microvirga sp. KLBC 81]